MAITNCPHTNRKHYAKVLLLLLNLFRICALVATESMEEASMLGTVFTRKDFSIQWGCAKPAISQTIIRY